MTRYIRQIVLLTGAILIGILAGRWWFGSSAADSTAQQQTNVSEWTCPMHPQIRQPEFGTCPICGMDLVPADAGGATDELLVTLGNTAAAMADIQTVRVQRGSAASTLTFNGRLSVNESALSEQVIHFPGRIEYLQVTVEGSNITAGQPIAKVYAPGLITAQQEWLDARRQGQTTLADAAYERLLRWKIQESQLLEVAASGVPVNTFTLLADQSGTVTERHVNVGDYVTAGAALYSLASLNTLWAWLDVYEQDIAAIRMGQQVSLEMTAYPGKVFTGQVSFIDPMINAAARTARVRVDVDNKGGLLKPDMFLTATVQTGTTGDALWIPRSAVLWTGPRSVVYVAGDDGYRLREVTLGRSVNQGYEVTEGLSEGESIVSKGAFVIDASAELADKTAMMTRQAGSQQHASVSTAMMEQWGAVVTHYLTMKNKLIAGNGEAARVAASEMRSALSRVDVSAEEASVATFWQAQLVRLHALVSNIAATGQIDNQRKEFIDLSKAMILVAKTLGAPKALFVQYCPMANDDKGAYWLSESNQVLNPYFGDMMLRCGTIEETLPFPSE